VTKKEGVERREYMVIKKKNKEQVPGRVLLSKVNQDGSRSRERERYLTLETLTEQKGGRRNVAPQKEKVEEGKKKRR